MQSAPVRRHEHIDGFRHLVAGNPALLPLCDFSEKLISVRNERHKLLDELLARLILCFYIGRVLDSTRPVVEPEGSCPQLVIDVHFYPRLLVESWCHQGGSRSSRILMAMLASVCSGTRFPPDRLAFRARHSVSEVSMFNTQ